MKSILDPTFRYVSSSETDLRKTFARVRSELHASAPVSASDSANALNELLKPQPAVPPGAPR